MGENYPRKTKPCEWFEFGTAYANDKDKPIKYLKSKKCEGLIGNAQKAIQKKGLEESESGGYTMESYFEKFGYVVELESPSTFNMQSSEHCLMQSFRGKLEQPCQWKKK